MEDIAGRIEREVGSWEGVTTHPHRFGGIEFRLGRREIGHLHGERWADLPFHRGIRDMLVETGRAQLHHVLPDTGWVSKQIGSDADVAEVIELFRLSYERARVAQAVRASKAGPGSRGEQGSSSSSAEQLREPVRRDVAAGDDDPDAPA